MATHRSLLILGAAVFPLVLGSVPAAAQPVASYSCRANTKFGKHLLSLRQGVDAKAPATIKPNHRFSITVDLKPGQLPGEVKGFKLKEVRDLALRVPIPPNSSYVSATLTGGSGLNSTPSVRLDGRTAVISVAGPIPGGAAYQLPTLTVRLKAGRRGAIVETRLQGTSYDNPGLTLTAKIKWKFVTINSPVTCYPNPNPPLTRTTIR
ncbi:cyclase [Kribbella yunnanensis]|uniref:Cyclase n=1 Tax=Kribbella yunnanensis TaxID=190194 RepID=A0ABP4U4W9_9ACTN